MKKLLISLLVFVPYVFATRINLLQDGSIEVFVSPEEHVRGLTLDTYHDIFTFVEDFYYGGQQRVSLIPLYRLLLACDEHQEVAQERLDELAPKGAADEMVEGLDRMHQSVVHAIVGGLSSRLSRGYHEDSSEDLGGAGMCAIQ